MIITEITPVVQEFRKIRLAPYCRVSSNSLDQLHSFAAQIQHYSQYIALHPEYELVDIYADEGITGTEMEKRDELNRLLCDCRKGLVDRIIVKSISRFARNVEELLVILRELKKLQVNVYFEENGIDSEKINIEMIVTFPGMAAQQESMAISGNMRWSIRKRMESGEFNTTYPAFGYELKKGKLIYDETEMLVVQRIFQMYLQGMGTQTIANILNEECVPRRHSHQRRWYHTTVKCILTNERYMGDALLQKKYRTDTLPFRLMTNKGEKPRYYVENSNIPIVSKEVFHAVQELIKARRVDRKVEKRLLTGRLRCPECGRAFRRQEIRGKQYWHCAGRSSGLTDCKSRRVREDAVYGAFTNMVWKLAENRHELVGELIQYIVVLQSKGGTHQDQIRTIDQEMADYGAKMMVVTRLHSCGVLSATDFTAQSAEINLMLTNLRRERRNLQKEDESSELLDDIKMLYDMLEEYVPSLEFDGALFEQMVTEITVDDNAHITFQLIGGLRLTEEINERGRCGST